MGFLQRVHSVICRYKEGSCEFRKRLNATSRNPTSPQPHREIPRRLFPPCIFCIVLRNVFQNAPGKIAWQVLLANNHAKDFQRCLRTRWSDYISDRAWSHLVLAPVKQSKIAADREILQVLLGLLLPRLSTEEKRV